MHPFLLNGDHFEPGGGLPLTDRGFRYGMSVFETIALRAGAPLLLEPHLAKLATAAATAGLRPPADWDAPTRAALLAPPISEGVARIYLTSGDHDDAAGRVALLFEAMPIPTELASARAVMVEFTPAMPFGKTGNYWPHLLARPASGDEAILHRPDGNLLGGAMTNLVLVRDGQLLTPAQPVRRGVVCDWLGAQPAPLTLADLATAEEAFLTNSRLGLRALTTIGEHRSHKSDRTYKFFQTAALWQRYREEVLGVS